MKRAGWIVLGLLVAAPLAWVLSVAAVLAYGAQASAERADAIVVLGAAQYNGTPSPVFAARLAHAEALWRDRRAPLVITTGGTGTGDTVSEAVVGRRFLMEQGLPRRAVVAEPGGTHTAASMEAAAGLMQRRGLRSAILVSDPSHMLRLKLLSLHLGLVAHSSPTRTSPIGGNSREWRRQLLRESVRVPPTLLFGPAARAEAPDLRR